MVSSRPQVRLTIDLAALGDALRGLELTLSDRPQADGDALAERLADIATELVAGGEEAAHLASDEGFATDLTRLTRLNGLLLTIARRFHECFAVPGQVRELARMGQRRRGEWPAWTVAVAGAVAQVWPALFATQAALGDCLSELATHLSHSTSH